MEGREVYEMVLGEYLSAAIFAFDHASILSGPAHRDAFCSIFKKVLPFFATFADGFERVDIRSRHAIDWGDLSFSKEEITGFFGRKFFVHSASFDYFYDHIDPISMLIYDAFDHEFEMFLVGPSQIQILVNADPIYFKVV